MTSFEYRPKSAKELQPLIDAVQSDDNAPPQQLVVKDGPDEPGFVYTYGNYRGYSHQPELINFWPGDYDNPLYANAAILTLMRFGDIEPFRPGEVREIPGLLGEDGQFPVRARLLNPTERVKALNKYLTACDDRAPVLLVEFPDTEGKFLDDPECDPELVPVYRRNAGFLMNPPKAPTKGFA